MGDNQDTTRHCKSCNAPRKGNFCHKCGEPTKEVSPMWSYPNIPPLEKIRALAKHVGYAVAVHGTQERDFDLIAAPWVEGAVSPRELLDYLAENLPATIIDEGAKPLGRYSAFMNMGNWTKGIDLSICPAIIPVEADYDKQEKTE